MGVIDMAKLAMQARKMQAKLKEIKAAGKSGDMSVMVQAPDNKVVEHIADKEAYAAKFPEVPASALNKIIDTVTRDFKGALDMASKEMQKKMAEQNDLMDSMKGLLSN